MNWLPGPPPDTTGLFLVVLDTLKVRKRHAVAGSEYAGDPVCVLWLGSKGWDTMRRTRVDADLVVRYVAVAPSARAT